MLQVSEIRGGGEERPYFPLTDFCPKYRKHKPDPAKYEQNNGCDKPSVYIAKLGQ